MNTKLNENDEAQFQPINLKYLKGEIKKLDKALLKHE